ncbi:hypothetical protein [Streptomyces sp. NPDC006140]
MRSVAPVRPVDAELPAHRDVLVIAYTARAECPWPGHRRPQPPPPP